MARSSSGATDKISLGSDASIAQKSILMWGQRASFRELAEAVKIRLPDGLYGGANGRLVFGIIFEASLRNSPPEVVTLAEGHGPAGFRARFELDPGFRLRFVHESPEHDERSAVVSVEDCQGVSRMEVRATWTPERVEVRAVPVGCGR